VDEAAGTPLNDGVYGPAAGSGPRGTAADERGTLPAVIAAGPFRIDVVEGRLWRDGVEVHLRPKTAAVLAYLGARAGRVVEKQRLARAVWDGGDVDDGTIRKSIEELRRALQDPGGCVVVTTVHGRGFRLEVAARATLTGASLVGRKREIAQLAAWHAAARVAPAARVVFVAGPPGMGKTRLVEAFAAGAEDPVGIRHAAPAQGLTEPFLAVSSALDALLGPEREARHGVGAVLRRLDDAAAAGPCVVVLEDLHWADPSMLEVLGLLARRDPGPPLFVIVTYRLGIAPGLGSAVTELHRDLRVRGRAHEILLGPLARDETRTLVAARLATSVERRLADAVYARTAGHPLFVDALLRAVPAGLPSRERVEAFQRAVASWPPTLQDAIDRELDALDAVSRARLDAASVLGVSFPIAVLAIMLDEPAADVATAVGRLADALCVVVRAGTRPLPAGRATSVFAFVHALYRERCYERLLPEQRTALHRRAADAMEQVWSVARALVAGELLRHCALGGLPERAVEYGLVAMDAAVDRQAYGEALAGLELTSSALQAVPAGRRGRMALDLAVRLGRLAGNALASERFADALDVALCLAEAEMTPADRFHVVRGIWLLDGMRGDFHREVAGAATMLRIAERAGDRIMTAVARVDLAQSLYVAGRLAESGVLLRDVDGWDGGPDDGAALQAHGRAPGVVGRYLRACVAWMGGAGMPSADADFRDSERIADALASAQARAQVLVARAWFSLVARDFDAACAAVRAAHEHAIAHELPYWQAQASVLGKLVDVALGRLLLPEAWSETDTIEGQPLRGFDSLALLVVAQAYGAARRWGTGLDVLARARALAERRGQELLMAELDVTEGELRLGAGESLDVVAACRRRGLAVAEGQGAWALALRAATALAGTATTAASRAEILEPVLVHFAGDATRADVRDARALLA
jgi:DNA-binding winged helix-turn-helix (wHTH) protein